MNNLDHIISPLAKKNELDIHEEYSLLIYFKQVTNSLSCDICHRSVAGDGVPCRVCCLSFHRRCLEESGRTEDWGEKEWAYVDNAHGPAGWSCFTCVSIR